MTSKTATLQVAALRKDPALQEDMLRVVRGMQATLHGIRSLMEDPETREGLVAHARALQEKVGPRPPQPTSS